MFFRLVFVAPEVALIRWIDVNDTGALCFPVGGDRKGLSDLSASSQLSVSLQGTSSWRT